LDDVGEVGEAAQFAPAFLGALAEFEHHVEHAVAAEAALGSFGAMADRGKGAFDWVRCPNALPMLGREVVEGEQLFSVLDQAFGGFGVFRLEGVDEQIEGGMGVLTRFGLPDVVQHLLDLGLGALG